MRRSSRLAKQALVVATMVIVGCGVWALIARPVWKSLE